MAVSMGPMIADVHFSKTGRQPEGGSQKAVTMDIGAVNYRDRAQCKTSWQLRALARKSNTILLLPNLSIGAISVQVHTILSCHWPRALAAGCSGIRIMSCATLPY